ncbi:hypothetical protein [Salinibaculum rarum]|uniref:hypothetical protein n=1 Tax=Salinibaculum rarum TaxID=3058903 RepID=UPI00265D8B95|nr:hypothetical protein [Salinibaculum sp. KK48]
MRAAIVTGVKVLGVLAIGTLVANLGLAFVPLRASVEFLLMRVVILGLSLAVGVASAHKIEEIVTGQ